MPGRRNSKDKNEFEYDEVLLEGEEPSVAAHRTTLQSKRVSHEWQQYLNEQRDTSRWKISIAIAVTAAITYGVHNLVNYYSDLQSELRELRDRITVLETIHSEKSFRPVHVHSTEPTREPMSEIEVDVP